MDWPATAYASQAGNGNVAGLAFPGGDGSNVFLEGLPVSGGLSGFPDCQSVGVRGLLGVPSGPAPQQLRVQRDADAAQSAYVDVNTNARVRPDDHGQQPPWLGGRVGTVPMTAAPTEDRNEQKFRAMLELCASDMRDDVQNRDKEKTKRAFDQLAQGAQYGEPSPLFYPSEDQLKKVTNAAKLGYWIPDLVAEPDTRCDRVLATYLKSLLPIAHAGLWQHRQTPAAVLNEMGHILDMSLDRAASRLDAERNAVRWDIAIRERLYKFSQARPLKEGDVKMFGLWQETFLFPESQRTTTTATGRQDAEPARDTTEGTRQNYCLWYLIGKCTQRLCTKVHACPLCADCGSRPSPLAWHLSQLRVPRNIVMSHPDEGRRQGDRGAARPAQERVQPRGRRDEPRREHTRSRSRDRAVPRDQGRRAGNY